MLAESSTANGGMTVVPPVASPTSKASEDIGRQLCQTGYGMTVNPAHVMNRLTLQLRLREMPTQKCPVEVARSLYIGGIQVRVAEHMNRVRLHDRHDQLAHRLDEEPAPN